LAKQNTLALFTQLRLFFPAVCKFIKKKKKKTFLNTSLRERGRDAVAISGATISPRSGVDSDCD